VYSCGRSETASGVRKIDETVRGMPVRVTVLSELLLQRLFSTETPEAAQSGRSKERRKPRGSPSSYFFWSIVAAAVPD